MVERPRWLYTLVYGESPGPIDFVQRDAYLNPCCLRSLSLPFSRYPFDHPLLVCDEECRRMIVVAGNPNDSAILLAIWP